jgi:hypothetical protein
VWNIGTTRALAANERERFVVEPPAEIGPQQELTVIRHARLHADKAVLRRPVLGQQRADRSVRDGELGLELQHDIGRVARADVTDPDERGRMLRRLCGGRPLLGARRVHARRWRRHVGQWGRGWQRLGTT